MPFGIGSITISASTFTVFQEIYLTDGEWAIFKGAFFEKSGEGRNRDRHILYLKIPLRVSFMYACL